MSNNYLKKKPFHAVNNWGVARKKGGFFPKCPAMNKSFGVEVALLVGRNKHVSNYFSLQCRAGSCWSHSEDSVFRKTCSKLAPGQNLIY